MVEDLPDQRRNGVLIYDRGSSRSVCLFKDDFTELFQACHVPWSPPSHIRLAGRRLSPLCPCGAVEDTHHYCFACSLLSPPSPTYADIFKSKTPSKLKPIASLLCEKVMTYSNKFLPSYETKMKFLQGIIIQALLTNLILFLIPLFHPKFSKLIASSIHSVIVKTGMSYTIQRYRTRNKCIQIQKRKIENWFFKPKKHSKIAIVVRRRRYWWYLVEEAHPSWRKH